MTKFGIENVRNVALIRSLDSRHAAWIHSVVIHMDTRSTVMGIHSIECGAVHILTFEEMDECVYFRDQPVNCTPSPVVPSFQKPLFQF